MVLMGFRESFAQGRADIHNGAGRPAPGRDRGPPLPPADRNGKEPSPIGIGRYCPLESDSPGMPLYSDTERHILMLGLNGAGKSTRFLIELLATTSNRSLLIFDLKGELAYQTADLRRRHSDVYFINPQGLHGLPSDGFNFANIDPNDPLFFSHLTDIGAAAIDFSEKDKHWDETAQSLFEGLLGWETIMARRERRRPAPANIRRMLCEPDEYEVTRDARGRRQETLIRGVTFTAQRIIAEGGYSLAGLVSRFVRKHGQNELSSIQSTADTQTKWMLDPMMAADLAKPGVDFDALRKRPTTIYVMIHPLELRKNKRWTRLITSAALCALMQPGAVRTLMVLDEFYASVGNLPILNDVWALVRGYGIQIMPMVQSILQLQALYREEWENYAAQAGLIMALGPAGDNPTAECMSKQCGVTTILKAYINESVGFIFCEGCWL
jgi:type IV secretion system protein VirD4